MRSKVAFPVDIDTRKYMMAMKIYSKEALPKAVAETLNRTADAVTKQQIKNVKKDLTIRTPFTLRSMEARGARPYKALNKARGKNVDRMFSRAGTFSNYLWMQEDNFTKTGMNGPVPIPTLAARIGKNEKKSIRKKYRLAPGQSTKSGSGDNWFIGIPKGKVKPKGLYERTNKNKKLRMLRNLEHDETKIKGTHFHSDSVKKYGTQQFIKAQFIKVSKRILKQKGIA